MRGEKRKLVAEDSKRKDAPKSDLIADQNNDAEADENTAA